MAITVISVPTATPDVPVPISDAFKFGFQFDSADIATTPGTYADVVITFPTTCTVPSNGDTLVLWSHTLTVDDTTNSTATTFKVVATGTTTATNFYNMLRSNIFFLKYTDIAISGLEVTITWKSCGSQENFSGTNMDDTAIVDTGGTMVVTNGTQPVYTPNFHFVCRLLYLRDSNSVIRFPLTQFEGFRPDVNCSGADNLYIDFMDSIRKELWPIMPELGPNTYVDNFGLGSSLTKEAMKKMGMLAYLVVEYGWEYQDANCQPKSGTFGVTDEFLVMNCYFNPEDTYKLRRFWRAHPSGYPPDQTNYRFVTNQPGVMRLCENSFAWLWYCESEASSLLRAHFEVEYLNGSGVNYYFTMPHKDDPIQNFNISPSHLAANIPIDVSEIRHYNIRMVSSSGTAVRTESLRVIVDHNCCQRTTDVYFVTQYGSIGTMPVKIETRGAGQSGVEVNLQNRFDGTEEEKAAYGGRSLFNGRAFPTIEFSARENYSEVQIKWFEQFRYSSHRWIKVEKEDGNYIAKKLLVDPGEVSIYKSGEKVILTASGYLQDIPIQSPIEPVELP